MYPLVPCRLCISLSAERQKSRDLLCSLSRDLPFPSLRPLCGSPFAPSVAQHGCRCRARRACRDSAALLVRPVLLAAHGRAFPPSSPPRLHIALEAARPGCPRRARALTSCVPAVSALTRSRARSSPSCSSEASRCVDTGSCAPSTCSRSRSAVQRDRCRCVQYSLAYSGLRLAVHRLRVAVVSLRPPVRRRAQLAAAQLLGHVGALAMPRISFDSMHSRHATASRVER